MSVRRRVDAVVDTNLLVRAVLRPRGVAGRIIRAFRRGRFTLVTSDALLHELAEALLGPSVQRVARIGERDVAELLAHLRRLAVVVAGRYQDVDVVEEDPTDSRLFACALEGRAEYGVSGDTEHVQPVKVWKPYETAIQVVGAPYFVRGVLGLPPPRHR